MNWAFANKFLCVWVEKAVQTEVDLKFAKQRRQFLYPTFFWDSAAKPDFPALVPLILASVEDADTAAAAV